MQRPGQRFGKGRKRKERGTMNGLEKAYSIVLEDRRLNGEIDSWHYEAFKLLVAEPPNALRSYLTVDFAVYLNDMTLEFHECKGYMEKDALQRLKAAAGLWPHKFVLVERNRKKDGGGWKLTEF